MSIVDRMQSLLQLVKGKRSRFGLYPKIVFEGREKSGVPWWVDSPTGFPKEKADTPWERAA